MANRATGKFSKAISDRSGMEFPYKEMVKEWNGSFVHISEFEAKHPQLEIKPHTSDPQGLRDARPDRTEPFLLQVGVARFDDFDAKIDPIFAQVGTVSITTS